MSDSSNDNQKRDAQLATGTPDPAGHAALLLVESLLHGLVARKVIEVQDAIDIVAVAADVKANIADDVGDTPASLADALRKLNAIRVSFEIDLHD